MKLSYSRVDQFERCPYKYRLRYVDGLKPLFNCDAGNALALGSAVHDGIERGTAAGVASYTARYPVLTDLMVNEIMKMEAVLPRVRGMIPEGEFEVEIDHPDFVGYIDLLAEVGDGVYDMYDFKYSKNRESYEKSPQLSIYKYFFELTHPGCRVRNLRYLLVPKTMIRQKKTEDLCGFRQRLRETLAGMEPELVPVEYDPESVVRFMLSAKRMLEATEYPKNPTKLCAWCDYQGYCEKGTMIDMALPKNERVGIESAPYMKGWIYGAPFSGKTTFLDAAPDPINLNTDGNTKYVTMQRVLIRDEVTQNGRITQRRFAWEALKDCIADLEKGSDYSTVIVDLVEDTREMCRLCMYDKLGIQHESDSGFGKGWDMIKTEYLSTMRRLLALDYNIFLVSHEDISKDVTKANSDKITKIMPNIQESLANKLAGMVDFVARVIVKDDGSRVLSFKANEVTFGGGRLSISATEIPLEWGELVRVYDEARNAAENGGRKAAPAKRQTRNAKAACEPAGDPEQPEREPDDRPSPAAGANQGDPAEKPAGRPRRARAAEADDEPEGDEAAQGAAGAEEKPARRSRRTRAAV